MIGGSREDDLLNKLKNCVGGLATKNHSIESSKPSTFTTS